MSTIDHGKKTFQQKKQSSELDSQLDPKTLALMMQGQFGNKEVLAALQGNNPTSLGTMISEEMHLDSNGIKGDKFDSNEIMQGALERAKQMQRQLGVPLNTDQYLEAIRGGNLPPALQQKIEGNKPPEKKQEQKQETAQPDGDASAQEAKDEEKTEQNEKKDQQQAAAGNTGTESSSVAPQEGTGQAGGSEPLLGQESFPIKEGETLQNFVPSAAQEFAKKEIARVSSLMMGSMPKFSVKQIENWKKQTGLSPQEHQAKGEALLSAFTTKTNGLQTALLEQSKTHQNNIISHAETQAGTFQTSVVDAGIQRSNQAFSNIKSTLTQTAQTANAAITTHQTTGKGLLDAAKTEQNRQMKEAFKKAREAISNEEAMQTTPFSAEKDKFVTQLDALAASERTLSLAKGEELAKGKDPSALSSGGRDLNAAKASLKADVQREGYKKKGKEVGHKVYARVQAEKKQADVSLKKILQQILTEEKQSFEGDLTKSETTVTTGLSKAGTTADNKLTSGSEAAKTAIKNAQENGTTKAASEQKRSEENLQKKGGELVEGIKGTGKELAGVIDVKSNEQAQLYSDVLLGLQKRLDGKGLIAFNQVKAAIDEAQTQLETHHATHLKELASLEIEQKGKLDESVTTQTETYNDAVEEQEGSAKKVSEDISKEINGAAGAFGNSLKGLVEKYNSSSKEQVDKITTDASEFQKHMSSSLEQQKTKVADGFQAGIAGLKVVFEDWRSKVLQDAEKTFDQEYKTKLQEKKDGATTLRSAMDGWGTEEGTIFAELRKGGWGEVEVLHAIYNDHYAHRAEDGRPPLRADLYDEMSGTDYKIATSYLNHNRKQAIKLELKDSTGFWNDDEERIKEVLKSASDEEIEFLHEAEQSSVLTDLRSALSDNIEDVKAFDALIDTSLDQEQRHLKADAIELLNSMEGMGTDEEKIKSILEGAKSEYERAQLRSYFDDHLEETGKTFAWGSLDQALESEFSGYEEVEVLELAKEERDESKVKMAKLLEAGDGAGTNEEKMFSALEDAEYAQKWKAQQKRIEDLETGGASPAEISAAKEVLRKMEEEREKGLNEDVRSLSDGDYKSVDEILNNESGKMPLYTYGELKAGKREDGTTLDMRAARFWVNRNLERVMAERLKRTGQVDPELKLRYAVIGAGTNEKYIKEALGNSPLPIATVNGIRDTYKRVWGSTAWDINEMQANANSKDFNGFRAPKGDIPSDISGDDFTDIRELMAGKPETPNQTRYMSKLRVNREGGTLLGQGFMWVADKTGFTDTRDDLVAQEKRFDKEFDKTITQASQEDGKDYGSMSYTDLKNELQSGNPERLQELGEYLQADAQAYGDTMAAVVDAIVTTLEIVAGIVATVLTAGTASPILAAIISNLIISAAGITIKAASLGSKYADEMGADVVSALAGAGLAGLGELKSVTKLARTTTNKTVSKLLGASFTDAGLIEVAEGTFKLSETARKRMLLMVEAGVKSSITGAAGTVTNKLTDESTYDKKLFEALFGEDSIGAALLKGLPRDMLQGGTTSIVGSLLGSGREGRYLKGETYEDMSYATARAAVNKMAVNVSGNTVGFLTYVDNYKDAETFWNGFLTSNLKSGIQGSMLGVAGHMRRADKLSGDLVRGADKTGKTFTKEQLKLFTWLTAAERKKIALEVQAAGHTDKLPDDYKALLSPSTPSAPVSNSNSGEDVLEHRANLRTNRTSSSKQNLGSSDKKKPSSTNKTSDSKKKKPTTGTQETSNSSQTQNTGQTNQSNPTSGEKPRRPISTSKDVVTQYKKRFPSTTLTEQQIIQKHDSGQVINPTSGRFVQTNSIEERDVVLTYISYNPNTSMTAHQILDRHRNGDVINPATGRFNKTK